MQSNLDNTRDCTNRQYTWYASSTSPMFVPSGYQGVPNTPELSSMEVASETCFGCGSSTQKRDECCVMCKFRGRFNPDDWSLHNEEVRLPCGKVIGRPSRVVVSVPVVTEIEMKTECQLQNILDASHPSSTS